MIVLYFNFYFVLIEHNLKIMFDFNIDRRKRKFKKYIVKSFKSRIATLDCFTLRNKKAKKCLAPTLEHKVKFNKSGNKKCRSQNVALRNARFCNASGLPLNVLTRHAHQLCHSIISILSTEENDNFKTSFFITALINILRSCTKNRNVLVALISVAILRSGFYNIISLSLSFI